MKAHSKNVVGCIPFLPWRLKVEIKRIYHKVASSSLSQLVAYFQIFRMLMKEKFDAYVLWPLAKKFQNWIVDRSTARNFCCRYKLWKPEILRFLYIFGGSGLLCGAASRPANDRQWLDERWRLRWWRKLFFHLLQDGVCPITSDPSDRTPSMKGSWFTRPMQWRRCGASAHRRRRDCNALSVLFFCTRESRLRRPCSYIDYY